MLIPVNRPRLKHLTGSFRGSPFYPERDDVEYVALKWYYMDGGRASMPKKMQDDEQGPVFTDRAVLDRMGDDASPVLDAMVADGSLELVGESGGQRRLRLKSSLVYGPPRA